MASEVHSVTPNVTPPPPLVSKRVITFPWSPRLVPPLTFTVPQMVLVLVEAATIIRHCPPASSERVITFP